MGADGSENGFAVPSKEVGEADGTMLGSGNAENGVGAALAGVLVSSRTATKY